MKNIKELDASYVAPTYARFPICLTQGSGSRVVDEEGKEYIDLGKKRARLAVIEIRGVLKPSELFGHRGNPFGIPPEKICRSCFRDCIALLRFQCSFRQSERRDILQYRL